MLLVILASCSGFVLAAQRSENKLELTDPGIFSTEVGELGDISSMIEEIEIDEEILKFCLPEETNQELNSLDPFLVGLDVYGHVRVRQETDFNRLNGPTRNRQRLRARLGANYRPADGWQIGMRMTTGDRKLILEPGDRSGAPLSYQDAGDVFDKFEFNLDRIFIRYEPKGLSDSWIQDCFDQDSGLLTRLLLWPMMPGKTHPGPGRYS